MLYNLEQDNIKMQDSQQLKSYRGHRLSSSFKQSGFGGISKSLTVSQGKTLQRYFYRRESSNFQKNQPISNRKIPTSKANSFHQNRQNHKSAKNTITNNGNEDNKNQDQTLQLPNLSKIKLDTQQQQKQQQQQATSMPLNQPLNKIFRRTSDWTIMYHKNVRPFTKNKRFQGSQIKLKLQPKMSRQKNNASNIQLAIRKHKADNVKQIQSKMRSVMSRIALYDSQKFMTIKDYNRKCGYSENDKIYIWNSEDQHIRRVLNRWGWIQNPSLQSPFFHLKWTYMPIFAQQKINQKQLINHFKNTQQITSKSYLSKNLKLNQSSFGKIDNYFPKCFDVGNSTQFNYFIQQYRHNVMLILLKRIYQFCYQKRQKQMNNYDLFYRYHYKNDAYNRSNKKAQCLSIYRSRGFRQIQLEDYKQRSVNFLLQINLIIEVLRYWRNFRKEKQQYEDHEPHFFRFKRTQFLDIFPTLQKYALIDDIGLPKQESSHFSKQLFSTPSLLLLQRISKQYQFCKQINNLFHTFGQNNIWIVKPTSNSRGSGIYLTTDLYQIQSSSKGIQSRLVQKYIQKPLIFKKQKFTQLYMRKFDIRQWVLLKSIDPLQIYIFSQCYLRLCYDRYKQKQITQLFRHLTNYSINKQKFKNKNQSVLPLYYLKQALKQQYKINWNKTIKPKIQNIIIKSIKSCIQNLQDCQNNCFQLFGFDILIDQQFNPWLLEINMSPACQQRTTWLTDYLNDMSIGLLKIILPMELMPSYQQKVNYKWELIVKQEACFNRKKDIQQGLQINGVNVKLDYQKVKDRQLLENQMAYKIQRFFKICIPKYKKYKKQKQNKRNSLNKYFKGFKYILEYKKKHELYSSKVIGKYVKSFYQQFKLKERRRKCNVSQIQRYFQTLKCERQYNQKNKQLHYREFINLARIVVFKKQAQIFFKQIFKKQQNILKIQAQIKKFIKFRQQKKQIFSKYFQSLLQFKNFQQKKRQYIKKLNISVLQKYLKPITYDKKVKKSILNSKQQLICKYLGSLLNRKQLYVKKLDIFISMVGRVDRVARRRARCKHFSVILSGWKIQIENQIREKMEIENKKIAKLIQIYKENNRQKQQADKKFKPGSIKSNKK